MTSHYYEVQNSDELFRWLHPSQYKKDEDRATSAAFGHDYMSVDIVALTSLNDSYQRIEEINREAKEIKYDAIASFLAEIPLSKNQRIAHCETLLTKENENVCITDSGCKIYSSEMAQSNQLLCCTNHSHACVIGKKTHSLKRAIAKSSKIKLCPVNPVM